MITEETIYRRLESLDIPSKIVEHPPARTTEEADSFIEGHQGVRTKSLFLTNKKKKRFFLVMMDDRKELDLKSFSDLVGENRIKLTSLEKIDELLGLEPGIVSIFGLPENHEPGLISIYYDQEMVEEDILTFHPNVNSKTIFVKTSDINTYVESLGYENIILDLD